MDVDEEMWRLRNENKRLWESLKKANEKADDWEEQYCLMKMDRDKMKWRRDQLRKNLRGMNRAHLVLRGLLATRGEKQ